MGWYHSHPSYGCWLSGIDVDTSERHQMMNDPFLAIVVDPIKSINFRMPFHITQRSWILGPSEFILKNIERKACRKSRMYREGKPLTSATITRDIISCRSNLSQITPAKNPWQISRRSNGAHNWQTHHFSNRSNT